MRDPTTPAEVAAYFDSPEFRALPLAERRQRFADLEGRMNTAAGRGGSPSTTTPAGTPRPLPPNPSAWTPDDLAAYFRSPEFRDLPRERQRARLRELEGQMFGRGAR